MSFLELTAVVKEALSGMKRSSAVQTIGRFCLAVTLATFIIATSNKDLWIPFFTVGCVSGATFIGICIYFMITDPDRLHSEEFQLRNRSLDIVKSKGKSLTLSEVDLIGITNPYPVPKRIATDSTEVEG